MDSAANRKCLILALLALPLGMVANSGSAQLIGKQAPLGLALQPTALLAARQVYPMVPSQFLREIERHLTGAGILVAPAKDTTRLMIEVKSYDSGPYVGLSKTARIAVGYELRNPSGDAIESWADQCEARVGLDAQDTADRNRTAVLLCLTMLGSRLAEKLAGPSAEVLVK